MLISICLSHGTPSVPELTCSRGTGKNERLSRLFFLGARAMPSSESLPLHCRSRVKLIRRAQSPFTGTQTGWIARHQKKRFVEEFIVSAGASAMSSIVVVQTKSDDRANPERQL